MAYPVLEHRLVAYRAAWRDSISSALAAPVLLLLGIGGLVGEHVDATGALPVDYLDYVGPGLLAVTAWQVAANESAWPVFASFQLTRTYQAMRVTSLRTGEILAGSIGFVLFRVLAATLVFLVVLAAFGTVRSLWTMAAIPVCLLVGLAMSAPAVAYVATIELDAGVRALWRFAVLPAALFSGVYFPAEALPHAARLLVYASPLWHGVELCRAATLDLPTAWDAATHLSYLLAWSGVWLWVAYARFGRRLRG